MDRDDDQPHLPGGRLYFGTFTPPAPYRVFRLIRGGAGTVEPTRPGTPDHYDCLTIKLLGSPHPHLRLVDESSAASAAIAPLPTGLPKF